MMKRISSLTLILVCMMAVVSCRTNVTEADLLPLPQSYFPTPAVFTAQSISVNAPDSAMTDLMGFISTLPATVDSGSKASVNVTFADDIPDVAVNVNEAYRLSVTSSSIDITATTTDGLYHALQTLSQLTTVDGGKYRIAGCEILDWPAFRHRGFMMDAARFYISMDELKREVEVMARYKMNVFHWHITDHDAWRLETKLYPELLDSIANHRFPGKYYTHEEIREFARFCKEHHVLLIPEIEMPGHSDSFVRAFNLNMQTPKGTARLKELLDEAFDEALTDLPYLHIGTEEVRFTSGTFVPEMVDYIRGKGKKVISWNPGWNYGVGEIDMMFLWSSNGKAHPGIPAVDLRYNYLNHFDTYADIIGLYTSKIYGYDQGNDDIAGGQIAVWNDRLTENETQIVTQNVLYPNLLAYAERLWKGGGWQYYDDFGTTLPLDEDNEARLAFIDFERRMLVHKDKYFEGYPFPYVKQTNVHWNITDPFPNGGDLTKAFPPEEGLQPSYEYDGKTYGVHQADGAAVYLRHVWGGRGFPNFFPNPEENHTAYAYTWIYSPVDQEAGALIETHNLSRSERDLPPDQGKWDFKESRIWLNGEELLPPTWDNTHRELTYNIPLRNENHTARPPLKIHLNKGWNNVLIKLPVGQFTQPEARLVKWMFTFVCTTPDGKDALDNITYSTNPQ